jgi:hypothetical protein
MASTDNNFFFIPYRLFKRSYTPNKKAIDSIPIKPATSTVVKPGIDCINAEMYPRASPTDISHHPLNLYDDKPG